MANLIGRFAVVCVAGLLLLSLFLCASASFHSGSFPVSGAVVGSMLSR
jgi:hypothetical protein